MLNNMKYSMMVVLSVVAPALASRPTLAEVRVAVQDRLCANLRKHHISLNLGTKMADILHFFVPLQKNK